MKSNSYREYGFDLIDILVFYLKTNYIYRDNLDYTNIRLAILYLENRTDFWTAESDYIGKFQCTIRVGETIIMSSQGDYHFYYNKPRIGVLENRALSNDEFEQYLRQNKNFFKAILVYNGLTEKMLTEMADSLLEKMGIISRKRMVKMNEKAEYETMRNSLIAQPIEEKVIQNIKVKI